MSEIQIRGLVLAGGKSSRFGTDKAMVLHEGASFLEKSISLMKCFPLKPVIVTRREADYSLAGCVVIYDKLPDKGPLGGLYTAMSIFKNTSFLVLPCDMPNLIPTVLSDLLGIHRPNFGITVYSIKSKIQPFPGVYEHSLLDAVQSQLKQDKRSMQGLLDLVPNKKVMAWKGSQEIFCNVNRVSDLRRSLTVTGRARRT